MREKQFCDVAFEVFFLCKREIDNRLTRTKKESLLGAARVVFGDLFRNHEKKFFASVLRPTDPSIAMKCFRNKIFMGQ